MLYERFIPHDSPEYNQHITDQFRQKFREARVDQRFEPLVIVDKHIAGNNRNKLLIIQLYVSYDDAPFGLLEYNLTKPILDMSLRLLTHLEEKYSLYKYLEEQGIARIMITTSPESRFINDSNKWLFSTDESLKLVRQLIQLKMRSKVLFENGLQALIVANQ